jgi:hypothetical protein
MRHTRAVIVILTGFVISAAALILDAPASFASRVVPPEGDASGPVPIAISHSPGMPGWEIAIIAVAAATLAAVLTATLMRVRVRSVQHAGAR